MSSGNEELTSCPKCNSEDIEIDTDDVETDGEGNLILKVECHGCEYGWAERWCFVEWKGE